MTLQRIKLPVFFYVFVPIQQVKVAKQSMLSTNYQPKRPPGPMGLSNLATTSPHLLYPHLSMYFQREISTLKVV